MTTVPYPPRGLDPWDFPLKSYIDDQDDATRRYVDQRVESTPAGEATDGAIAGYIASFTSLTAQALDAKIPMVNVKNHGAIGNGVVDDTPAVQAAMDEITARGGGILYYPPGTYLHGGNGVKVASNVTVLGDGAVITVTPGGYDAFYAMNNAGQGGYGAGAKDVEFRNLTFKGDLTNGKDLGNTFHHVDGLRFFDCIFDECVGGGHAIDLGGCRNVVVERCQFIGCMPQAGAEYVEAVQLDDSTAVGMSDKETNRAAYDGLPTIDVLIHNCQFLPKQVGATLLYAPNPTGTHTTTQGARKNRISFIGNLVRDWRPTDTYATAYQGPIHIAAVDNFLIKDNIFELTTSGSASSVITVVSSSSGILTADIANPHAAYNALPAPVVGNDIRIIGNKISGIDGPATNENIVAVQGSGASRPQRVSIIDNEWVNCYPAALTSNVGGASVYLYLVDHIVMSKNRMDYVRALHRFASCQFITVTDNICRHAGYRLETNNCLDMVWSNNIMRDFAGGASWELCTRVLCEGNLLINPGSYNSVWGGVMRSAGSDKVAFVGNVIDNTAGTEPVTTRSAYQWTADAAGAVLSTLGYARSNRTYNLNLYSRGTLSGVVASVDMDAPSSNVSSATGILTAASGWSIASFSWRRLSNDLAYMIVHFTRTGAAITVPANGDVANSVMGTLSAAYWPLVFAGTTSGGVGRVAVGELSPSDGSITLGAVGGSGDIATGDTLQVKVLYPIAPEN